MTRRAQDWRTYKRILIRPEPGFYVMRLRSGAPLVPAIIYQICPMVIPEPTTVTGPHPDEWCRPLDRSPRFAARVDGKRVDVELVWTARSLRRVSRDERARVTLTLNGRKLSAEAEPRLLLSDFLRHALGATGTHVGCEHGICGCCTVMIDGVAQRSCLTLAVQVEGREVQTVESLAAPDGTLNPLQQAFRNNHALQCGFCTPGILMSFTDFLARNPHPSEAEIREVLSGHLCRCTGYAGIVAAVVEVASSSHALAGEGA